MDDCTIAGYVAVRKACLAVLVLLVQTGCSTFSGHPQPVVDPEVELLAMAPQHNPATLVACAARPSLACRGSIAAARIRAVDIRFSQFETRLFRQTREAAFGATMAALGFTTAATITGGSARAFAATAGLITAGREAFDKEMLAQQTTLAIHSAMRTRRAVAAERLAIGLNSTLQVYSVHDMQRDLQAYEDAGNVLSALIGVNQVVGEAARKAELKLDQTFRFQLDSDQGKLRNAVCIDENCTALNKEKMRQLLVCMKSAALPAEVEADDLILQPGLEALRSKVLPCMNL